LPDDNLADVVEIVRIKPDSTIYVGEVADQSSNLRVDEDTGKRIFGSYAEGGGDQIYILNQSDIEILGKESVQ